ncbi:MAG: outer membrane receptor protein involved in Fe transport [Cyclobacteriaceae bacterium]|jgi:outer membrane receptor protein involved in Fe transport
MLMKRCLIAFLIFIPSILIAQDRDENPTQYKIQGKIINANNKSVLEYATVAILNPSDSSIISGGITDANGQFLLTATAGTVLINAQYISYESVYRAYQIDGSQSTQSVGDIELSLSANQLNEVIVTGEQDNLQLALDKRVFNVGKNITNAGRNAADILDNIPSVEVDIEGNVSLRGNQNVNILIDGKPSGIVGLNNPAALRMLQGNMIERIEVITNPSARYDAEGTGGIINIVLKKDSKKGFNGSVDASIGHPDNYRAAVNLNFRQKKINYFINYGVGYERAPGSAIYRQEFFTPDTTYFTDTDRLFSRGGISQNARAGADYYFNEKTTLTGAFYRGSADETNNTTVSYRDYDGNRNIINNILRLDTEKEPGTNQEYSLNYKKEFEEEAHTVSVFSQYQDNEGTEFSDITQTSDDELEAQNQRVDNHESETNFLIQADYIRPTSEKGKLEIGYKSNFRRVINNYLVEDFQDNDWVSLDEFTNDFIYREVIHAGYFIISNELNRMSYQLGLRTELTDISTNLVNTQEVNDKNYIGFFPTSHFTYKLDEITTLQASYSRRLRRPYFRSLNPFSNFSDVRNFRTGNPDLNPEYTNSFELGYLKNWEGSSFFASAYYNNTSGVMTRVYLVDENGITNAQYQNLARRNSYGLEFTANKDLFDWWKVNGSFNFYRSITDGQVGEQTLNADNYTWSTRVNSKITIQKTIDFQTNFSYRGPSESTQGTRKSYYTLDVGLSKDVFNNKGTIIASIQDVFNTSKYRYTNFGDTFYSDNVYQRRTTQYRLSLNYRINQKKKKSREKQGSRNLGDGGF